MFKFDTESGLYDIVANVISLLSGFGASRLIGSACNIIISNVAANGGRTALLTIGKFGMEGAVGAAVISQMRESIDMAADMYNKYADMYEVYSKTKSVEDSDKYVEVN